MSATSPLSTVEAIIAHSMSLLIPDGAVTEMRVLGPGRCVGNGYYDEIEAFARDAARWSGKAAGVYWTINPCDPTLLSRAKNRLREYVPKGEATEDKDILRRRYLPIDIDPIRPAGVCATHLEHCEALAMQGRVVDYLKSEGYDPPLEIDSGNGAYVLIPLDLPNDEASARLVRRCLEALAARFNTDKAHVDTSTHNASRILRVPGTLNCKGDSTEQRPHRRALLTLVPGVEL